MKQFIFLDLETSGLDAAHGKLISLSALRISRSGFKRIHTQRFCTLLCPSAPLSREVESLTGLTNDRLSQAPEPAEAITKFEDWRKDDPIVLCRPEFDLPFLTAAYRRAGLAFPTELVHTAEEDTVRSLIWDLLF